MADEKGEEKQQEKDREKRMEEKWERDPVGALVWAAILIWAGVVFLLENLGFFAQILINGHPLEAWPVVLLGASLILVLEVIVRLLLPQYRRPLTGTIVIAVVLFGLGLGSIFDIELLWPLLLILAGLLVLLGRLVR